jgi:hypothetical protein
LNVNRARFWALLKGKIMNLEPLTSLIRKQGLEEHQQTFLATVKPAIAISLAEKGQGNIGQSRIGGYPDLPVSLSWPLHPHPNHRRPLCFILQLNFSELPEFAENPLPKKGMLYLFQGEGDNDAEQLVIYQGDEPLQPTRLPEDTVFITDWYSDLVAHTLEFSLFADIPRWSSDDFEALAKKLFGEDGDSEDLLNGLGGSLTDYAENYVGKLFGHVSGIGHDPREDAFVVREVNPDWLYKSNELRNNNVDLTKAKFWQNLLELHSDDDANVMFGDAGYLQVLIHENDLKKQDFSKVYVNLESS